MADLPYVRASRETHRALIERANEIKAQETDPAMLLAACVVIDQLHSTFDRLGRALDRLESQAVSS